jgi:hypothetical protein
LERGVPACSRRRTFVKELYAECCRAAHSAISVVFDTDWIPCSYYQEISGDSFLHCFLEMEQSERILDEILHRLIDPGTKIRHTWAIPLE